MAARRLAGPEVRDHILAVVADYEKRRDVLREDPQAIEALHDYRKGARRVMAAIHLGEAYLTPVRFVQATSLAVPLARGLGKCRDADVIGRRLNDIANKAPKGLREDMQGLAGHMSRKERARRVQAATRTGKPNRLRKPLEEVLAGMSRSLQDPLQLGLARLRLRCARVHGRAALPPLHAFRLELKSYRYGLGALRPVKNSLDARLAADCHEATEAVGRIIDAHVLASLAGRAKGRAVDRLRRVAMADDEAARQDFHDAWTGTKWSHLKAELRGRPA